MKLLLSSIGSRGEEQRLVALALELCALSHTPILYVAPNFKPWVESFGIDCAPFGPDAGAVILGKTNVSHGRTDYQSDSPADGCTNPHNLARLPGTRPADRPPSCWRPRNVIRRS